MGEFMATGSKVEVGLELKTTGLNEANKAAAQLHSSLQGAATAAEKVRVPGPVMAAREGVMATQSRNYGVARGAIGTGAESRDFAKQSQGLGGLVRVYATFAANIFAVTAAFNALSKAADTSNMIKGLDQLGASTGRNLGSISKALVEVTDGAISMRDAMQATAQATAGGMSAKNVERLGQAAKVASQALGLNMSDALSRLSRGITKIEPELLDELGIFVRVDDAARSYALSIGKTSSQLTDFERRQAFANAVLTQAEKKFGDIKLDSSPYDKLAATFSNVTQNGLMLLNKVLGPIVNVLASSPTALTAALVGIGLMLTKQALPALSSWKSELHAASEEAAKLAKENLQAFKDFKGASLQNDTRTVALNYKTATQELDKQVASVQELSKLTKGRNLASAAKNIDEKTSIIDLDNVRNLSAKRLVDLQKQEKTASAEKLTAIAAEKAAIGQLTLEINGLALAQEKANLAKQTYDKSSKFGGGYFGQEAKLERIAKDAAAKAKKLDIIDVAVENTKSAGTVTALAGAYGQLSKAVSTGELSKVGALFTGIRAGAAIAATAIGTLVASLSTVLIWVQVLSAALLIIDNIFSSNEKQVNAFNSALDGLNGSVEGVSNTLELISKKDPLERLSIQSVTASSNALEDLANSTDTLVSKFNKVRDSTYNWDSAKDVIFGFFTNFNTYGAQANKTAEGLADSTKAFLDSATSIPEYQARLASINKILGTSNLTTFTKKDFLATGLTPQILKQLVDLEKQASDNRKKSVSDLNLFKDSLNTATKSQQEFITSLSNNDPLFKMGADLQKLGLSYAVFQGNTESATAAIIELLKSPDNLALFGEKIGTQLAGLTNDFEKLTGSVKLYSDQLQKVKVSEDALGKLQANMRVGSNEWEAERQRLMKEGGTPTQKPSTSADFSGISGQAGALKRFERAVENAAAIQQKVVNLVNEGIQTAFERGAKLVSLALTNANIKAVSIINSALTTNLTGPQAARAALEQTKIDVQMQLNQIEIAKTQLDEQQKIRAAVELSAALAKKTDIEKDPSKYRPKELDTVNTQINAISTFLEKLKEPGTNQQKFISGATQSGLPSDVSAAFMLSGARNAVIALEARKKELVASITRDQAKVEQADAQKQSDLNKAQVEQAGALLKLQKDRKDILDSIIGGSSEYLAVNNIEIEKAKLLNSQTTARADQEAKINALMLQQKQTQDLIGKERIKPAVAEGGAIKSTGPAVATKGSEQLQSTAAQLAAERTQQEKTLADLKAKQEAEQYAFDTKAIQDKYNLEKKLLLNLQANQKIATEDQKQIRDAQFAAAEALYQNQKDLGQLTQLEILQKDKVLERTKLIRDAETKINEFTQEKLDLEAQISLKQSAYINARSQQILIENGMLDRVQARIQAEEEFTSAQDPAERARLDRLAQQRDLEQKILDIKLKSLDTVTAELIKQATIVDNIDALSKSLTSSFSGLSTIIDGLGESIGGALKAMVDMANRDQKFTQDKLAAQEELNIAIREGNGLKEQAAQDKLDKLDKDNTKRSLMDITAVAAANKKMFGEKTAAYRILNGIEKAAAVASSVLRAKELAETAIAAAKTIGINIPAIYSSFMKTMGPWGIPAAAAAIAAFVGGAFGGGNTTVDMTGQTAEERQKTQGTGTVTGDSTAKSQSLGNSLELLNKNSVEGLSYSNRMVELLSSINKNISGVAKDIYSVVGLTSGSMFNTKEGKSGYNILGGLLGSTTNREIVDSGITIKGTFADLVNGAEGFANAYEKVLTTSTRSFLWFSSTSQSLNTQLQALDTRISNGITKIFSNTATTFVEVGKDLGITEKQVMSDLANVDLTKVGTISTRGLKGQELADAITANISAMLDMGAEAVFKQVEEYNKLGEGMFETAVRVTNDLRNVNLAMQSIGKQTVGGGPVGIKISEALVEAAGGLGEFLDKTKTFNSKFLTEAERLAPIQAAVNKELTSLGYSANISREQFKQLIIGFKVTDKASAETYNKLLNLSGSIDQLASASENAAKKLATDQLDQLIKILNLLDDTGRDLNGSEKALALTRKRELDALDAALKPGQIYINALEDEKALKTKLTTAYNNESTAIKGTISSLKASVKSLKDYKTALTAGSSTILTPSERYTQAKLNLMAVAQAAKAVITPTSTKEEIAARDEALSKLSGTSDTFLTSSRELYASSEQYTQDFKSVLDILDGNTGNLEDQLSTAEKSLNALEDSVSALNLIQDNTQTTAELLAQYVAAQATTNAAREAYETNQTTAAASSTTQIVGAVNSSTVANDTVTTAAATTVANAVTGTTAATTDAAKKVADTVTDTSKTTATDISSTIADGRDAKSGGWSDMTTAEKAAYYADNPTMGAVTRGLTTAFGYTTLGTIVNTLRDMIDPAAKVLDLATTYGIDTSNGLGLGIDSAQLGDVAGPRAKGGYSPPGTYLVGELGPELVDFNTPGRVYTAEQTFGMFNGTSANAVLVEEIRALRQEVAQLRKQQQSETGDIIISNYDATQKASDNIVKTIVTTTMDSLWTARSKPELR